MRSVAVEGKNFLETAARARANRQARQRDVKPRALRRNEKELIARGRYDPS